MSAEFFWIDNYGVRNKLSTNREDQFKLIRAYNFALYKAAQNDVFSIEMISIMNTEKDGNKRMRIIRFSNDCYKVYAMINKSNSDEFMELEIVPCRIIYN
jgi:hypothetical protein